MTSAGQASAGRTSANKTDHASNRQRVALGLAAQHGSQNGVEPGLSTQGRPPRGASEAGLQRIVNAMRAALRSRQNIHVTRKEIAQFAGVTPALVTYYFPDKNDLIEAVTIPVVTAMVEAVQNSLNGAGDLRGRLLQAIDALIASYAKDAVVVDLFIAYRASNARSLPDLIGEMEAALAEMFNQWLQQHRDTVYDAAYLQKAAIGMCKIVARRDPKESAQDASRDARRMTQAEAVCAMLLEPMAVSGGPAPAATGPIALSPDDRHR